MDNTLNNTIFHPVNNTPSIKEVKARLTILGIPFKQPTAYQIKVGDLNFYCPKGTVTRDNHLRLEGRGLKFFYEQLRLDGFNTDEKVHEEMATEVDTEVIRETIMSSENVIPFPRRD